MYVRIYFAGLAWLLGALVKYRNQLCETVYNKESINQSN